MVKLAASLQTANPDSWAASILSASADKFWILTVVAICGAVACGYGIFYFIRRARIIEDTPTSRIRSAPQGYVEIVGQIKYFVNEPIIAPLTKLPCAWYHFTIEKQETVHTRGTSHTRWRTVEQGTSDKAFVCMDETGQCLIDPRGAEVHANNEDTWYGATKWPESGKHVKNSFFSSKDYRYQEQRLLEDESLYAIGLFKTIDPNKAHGDVTEEVRAILKVWKQDQSKLLQRFDTNQDGQIDLQEWEQVRHAATQQAYQQRLSRADRPAINMMTKTGDFRRPYILSVTSPDRITRKFKLKAFACLAGFVLLTPLTLWAMIVRLSA